MKKIVVRLGDRSYDILIGKKSLKALPHVLRRLDVGRDAFVITNAMIKSLYGVRLKSVLRQAGCSVVYETVPDSERAKSTAVCINVLNRLARYDTKRRIFIVALGGGVIGDLAGFVASVYRRGVPFIQIPTTLLAQVDSAIGGKVAVDLPIGKNLVGAFYQPKVVIADISLLESLSEREVKNGLAEIVKYGLIKDASLFAYVERCHQDILARKPACMHHILTQCSKIKAAIVAKDERDNKDVRIILNCGHTIGHAIEAAGAYKRYTHGEAVAIGMVAEARLSVALGLLGPASVTRLENLLKAIGLPTTVERISPTAILAAQEHDKKIIRGVNRFVLPIRIGATTIRENIPIRLIRSVIEERLR